MAKRDIGRQIQVFSFFLESFLQLIQLRITEAREYLLDTLCFLRRGKLLLGKDGLKFRLPGNLLDGRMTSPRGLFQKGEQLPQAVLSQFQGREEREERHPIIGSQS